MGDREKVDQFLSQLKRYYLANIGVPEFNSWIRKVVITCTYIQGALVDKWVDRTVDWLLRLDPLIDDIENVWDQFLDAFADQFQDSQKGEHTCTGLETIKMNLAPHRPIHSRLQAAHCQSRLYIRISPH